MPAICDPATPGGLPTIISTSITPWTVNKNFVSTVDEPDCNLSVTLCDNTLATWFFNSVENELSIPPYYFVLVTAGGVDEIIRYFYQVPRWLEYEGGRSDLTISATVPRVDLVGEGYPVSWSYKLYGLGLVIGQEIPNPPECRHRRMIVLQQGSITVQGQATTPALICDA